MKRILGFVLVALAVALPANLPANNVPTGNWRLTTLAPTGNQESTNWLFKVETEEGKTTGTLLGTTAKKGELTSFDVTGEKVRIVVKAPGEQVFEGRLVNGGKKIVGVLLGGKSAVAAYLTPTENDKLEKAITGKVTLSNDELKAWADAAVAVAREHNAAADVNMQFAAGFLSKKNSAMASEFALAAEKALNDRTTTDAQVKVLQLLVRAMTEAGKNAEVAPFAARLEKLETILDTKYKATVPPFKATPFEGRKSESNRVVVLELFTGAQCPPCVAADVAFDVLSETYKPTELALIQYHLHIPGPDPMTNADTEARAKYYKANSTPTYVYNGGKKVSGGGAMAAAEKIYGNYRKVLDPILEEDAGCRLTASARITNGTVKIQADVAGIEKPSKDIKVRLVLCEEHVRFVGSNGLRFHHNVVRAMPGGVDGTVVEKETGSVTSEVKLNDLRKQLVGYLDQFDLKRPFPQIPRPLDLTHLRVIAFVQDDSTQQILQAVQVDVKD